MTTPRAFHSFARRALATSFGLLVTVTPATRAADAPAPPVALRWQPLYEPGNGGAMVSIRVSPHDRDRILCGGDMLSMALSTDRGATWQSTFGFKSYEMADVTWHPTDPMIVWAGTMSGPYKSVDGGVNWTEKRAGMPAVSGGAYTAGVERVLIDPTNPDHLVAIGGTSRRWADSSAFGWMWDSADAGETWRHVGTVTADGSTTEAVKGVNLVAAAFKPGSGKSLVALGAEQGVYVSDDAGRTWKKSNAGLPHAAVRRLATHPTDPNVLWVSLGSFKPAGEKLNLPGGIFKSTDGGATWSRPCLKTVYRA